MPEYRKTFWEWLRLLVDGPISLPQVGDFDFKILATQVEYLPHPDPNIRTGTMVVKLTVEPFKVSPPTRTSVRMIQIAADE